MSDEKHPDTEKVVDLFPEVAAPPLKVTTFPTPQTCKHRQCSLDQEQRLCVCSACGARIEAFDWLVEHAGKDWTRYWTAHSVVRREISRLRVEHEDLKREVRNLKSQAKRWRATTAKLEAVDPPELGSAPVALKSTPDVSS